MKTILTDCDGVLLNWNKAFQFWMSHHGYSLQNQESYEISKRYGISQTEAFSLVCTFNESPEIGYLSPQDDAVEWVKKLNADHGYKFTVISSVSDDDSTLMWRRKNLELVFGAECFDQIICIPCGADKRSTLRDFPRNLWWIEDKPENAEVGRSLGFKCLLYTLDHNRNHPSTIPRVNSWKEIYDIVTSE